MQSMSSSNYPTTLTQLRHRGDLRAAHYLCPPLNDFWVMGGRRCRPRFCSTIPSKDAYLWPTGRILWFLFFFSFEHHAFLAAQPVVVWWMNGTEIIIIYTLVHVTKSLAGVYGDKHEWVMIQSWTRARWESNNLFVERGWDFMRSLRRVQQSSHLHSRFPRTKERGQDERKTISTVNVLCFSAHQRRLS